MIDIISALLKLISKTYLNLIELKSVLHFRNIGLIDWFQDGLQIVYVRKVVVVTSQQVSSFHISS